MLMPACVCRPLVSALSYRASREMTWGASARATVTSAVKDGMADADAGFVTVVATGSTSRGSADRTVHEQHRHQRGDQQQQGDELQDVPADASLDATHRPTHPSTGPPSGIPRGGPPHTVLPAPCTCGTPT